MLKYKWIKIVEIIGTDLEKIQDAVNSLFIQYYREQIPRYIGTKMKEKNSAKYQWLFLGDVRIILALKVQMEYGPLIDIIKPFIPNAESIKENVEKFTEIQKKLNAS